MNNGLNSDKTSKVFCINIYKNDMQMRRAGQWVRLPGSYDRWVESWTVPSRRDQRQCWISRRTSSWLRTVEVLRYANSQVHVPSGSTCRTPRPSCVQTTRRSCTTVDLELLYRSPWSAGEVQSARTWTRSSSPAWTTMQPTHAVMYVRQLRQQQAKPATL